MGHTPTRKGNNTRSTKKRKPQFHSVIFASYDDYLQQFYAAPKRHTLSARHHSDEMEMTPAEQNRQQKSLQMKPPKQEKLNMEDENSPPRNTRKKKGSLPAWKQMEVLCLVLRYLHEQNDEKEQHIASLEAKLQYKQETIDRLVKTSEEVYEMNTKLLQTVKKLKEKLVQQKQYFLRKLQNVSTEDKLLLGKMKKAASSTPARATREESPKKVTVEKKQAENNTKSAENDSDSDKELKQKIANLLGRTAPRKRPKPYPAVSSPAPADPVTLSSQPQVKEPIRERHVSPVTVDNKEVNQAPSLSRSSSSSASLIPLGGLVSSLSTSNLLEQSPSANGYLEPAAEGKPISVRWNQLKPTDPKPKLKPLVIDQNQPKKREELESVEVPSDDKRDSFPEYVKCPKCNRTFEKRKDLLFSMCACGHVVQTQNPLEPKPPQIDPKPPKSIRLQLETKPPEPEPKSQDSESKPPPPQPPPGILVSEESILARQPSLPGLQTEPESPPLPPPPPPPKIEVSPPEQIESTKPKKETTRDNSAQSRDSLLESIKNLQVNAEERMAAIENAFKQRQSMQTKQERNDPMKRLFRQIQSLKINSESRLTAMNAVEEARKKLLESKRKVIDERLLNQKQVLKNTGGIDKIEQMRRQKDEEFIRMIPSFDYGSEDDYFDDIEPLEESDDDEGGLMGMVSTLVRNSPNADQTLKSSPSIDSDLSDLVSSLMKKS